MSSQQVSPRSFVQADQPWIAPGLARVYDMFPFEADIPFYRELAAAQGGRVLEPACGTGRVLVPLAAAGNRVVGLDASPHMLELAREKIAAAGPDVAARVDLLQGDMRAFEVDEAFDLAIIAVKSFAYLTTPEEQLQALSTVARHLRPGGLLALDLLNPSIEWLSRPPGSLNQDLARYVPEHGITVLRTETTVSTDFATQVRVIRSMYQFIGDDGAVSARVVEWPFRYTYRFEAEHLLERAGLRVEAVYGGYQREPFTSDASVLMLLARRPEDT